MCFLVSTNIGSHGFKAFTGRLIVGSDVYTYYVVLDVISPIIEVIDRNVFVIRIKAYDFNVNVTGVITITFSQNDRNYTYTITICL
ncbi:MAG: hypothetical protein DRO15_02830 [Thermoprotei archaeon]|nr:MAG: hypothetical protein DRO15_02830 [Thermoprotei archaeon]